MSEGGQGEKDFGFETNESYRKLNIEDRKQVSDVIESLSELFEKYMLFIDEEIDDEDLEEIDDEDVDRLLEAVSLI